MTHHSHKLQEGQQHTPVKRMAAPLTLSHRAPPYGSARPSPQPPDWCNPTLSPDTEQQTVNLHSESLVWQGKVWLERSVLMSQIWWQSPSVALPVGMHYHSFAALLCFPPVWHSEAPGTLLSAHRLQGRAAAPQRVVKRTHSHPHDCMHAHAPQLHTIGGLVAPDCSAGWEPCPPGSGS